MSTCITVKSYLSRTSSNLLLSEHLKLTTPTLSPCPPTFPLDMLANVPVYLWWVTSSASVHSSIVHPHTFVHTYVRCVNNHAYVGCMGRTCYDTFLEFHCRHAHYTIPAVTGIYRHSTILRYCRYMHLQYSTHFNPLLLSATHPPLLFLYPLPLLSPASQGENNIVP